MTMSSNPRWHNGYLGTYFPVLLILDASIGVRLDQGLNTVVLTMHVGAAIQVDKLGHIFSLYH